MTVRLLFDLYALLVGLVTGSYLNVVIHRLPRGVSTVLPRSRCPGCGAAIQPWDNVPVLSWLILRGRCRACGEPIAWRYPFVELLTGLLFLACVEAYGPSLAALAAAVFCALLVALAGIDLEHYLLLDRLTLPGIAVGFLASFVVPWVTPVGSVFGALLGALVLLAAYGGWWLVRRQEGLGLGDVKMLAMIGAFLGWHGVVVSLLFAVVTGSLIGLGLVVSGRGSLQSRLPFGVFLAVGAVVALFFGQQLVAAYLATALGPLAPVPASPP